MKAYAASGLEISGKERGEIVEADNQERREESRDVVMGYLCFVSPKNHVFL